METNTKEKWVLGLKAISQIYDPALKDVQAKTVIFTGTQEEALAHLLKEARVYAELYNGDFEACEDLPESIDDLECFDEDGYSGLLEVMDANGHFAVDILVQITRYDDILPVEGQPDDGEYLILVGYTDCDNEYIAFRKFFGKEGPGWCNCALIMFAKELADAYDMELDEFAISRADCDCNELAAVYMFDEFIFACRPEIID